MTAAASDSELLRLSAGGDQAAFAVLMDRYWGPVYRFLVSVGANQDDAEDALQECFISVWKSAATFRGTGSARAWLFAIARNALRRQARRRAGEPTYSESLERLGDRAGWGTAPAFTPRFEAVEELEWALGQLPRGEREVVVLRDLEALSGTEAAAALGLSVAAMKSRLHRGRLRLMGVLREEGAHE